MWRLLLENGQAGEHHQLLGHVSQGSFNRLEARVDVSALRRDLSRLIVEPTREFVASLPAVVANLLEQLDGEVRRFHWAYVYTPGSPEHQRPSTQGQRRQAMPGDLEGRPEVAIAGWGLLQRPS